MKSITIVVDGAPKFKIEVSQDTTIGQIKKIVEKQGKYSYDKLEVYKGKGLPGVLSTSKYDKVKLGDTFAKLKDARLYVIEKGNAKASKKDVPAKKPLFNAGGQKYWSKIRDVDLLMLSNLSYSDLTSVCQVSRYSRELCQDTNFWRKRLEKDFPLRSIYLVYPDHLLLKEKYPRKLYDLISQKSKIVEVASGLSEEDLGILEGDDSEIDSEEMHLREIENHSLFRPLHPLLRNLTEEIKTGKYPIFRGDMVHIKGASDYRNDGKYAWDGKNAIRLNYRADDYGAAPESLSFPEFPLNHFRESIDHNEYIFLSESAVEEAIRTFHEKKRMFSISDMYDSYELPVYYEETFKKIPKTKEVFEKALRRTPYLNAGQLEIFVVPY